jgi:hypothetical protein
MRALPKPRIAKALLRDDEIVRRKFSASNTAKISRSKFDLAAHRDARKRKAGRPNARIFFDGVAAITAFYGVAQREKEPALCPKKRAPTGVTRWAPRQ